MKVNRTGRFRWSPRRLMPGFVAVLLMTAGGVLPHAHVAAQGPPAGVGQAVALEGELDVLYEDASGGSRLVYFLKTVGGRVPLRFRGVGPDLRSGSRVRVAGNLEDGAISATTVATIAASPARTLGEQTVLVILFNFSNNVAEPYTTSAVDGVNAQVRDFFLENSYQQTETTFTVTGWHTIAAANTTCDYNTWATQADTAATNAGFNVSAYARRVYAFPQTSACTWWGIGNVGGPRSWINGTYATRVVAHEQGHNFGNRHSHAMRCDAAGCVSVDYGDDRDVMGAGGVVGHMNALQKERLGWLDYGSSPVIQAVSASGDYWIDNYEALGANSKALKIWNAATGTYYYVEAREQVGFDAGVLPGVVLHRGSPSDPDSSYEIDLAPATTAWDSTLDVGQTFTDAALGVSIATLASTAAGALVRVAFDPSPCAAAAPAVSLAPASQTGAAGATFYYTMTVTNRNGAGCAPSPIAFAASVPSGWLWSFSPASAASLAPGTSTSTTLSLIPSNGSGSYVFNASAADGTSGLAANATGSASILGNLDVTVSAVVGRSGKTRSATITATVRNGSLLVSGATVAVTVTKPTGATSTVSATTGTNGVATVKYSLTAKDPSGIYDVRAIATTSAARGNAATSFTIP